MEVRAQTMSPKGILKTKLPLKTQSVIPHSASKKNVKVVVPNKGIFPTKNEVVTCSGQLRTRSFTETDLRKPFLKNSPRFSNVSGPYMGSGGDGSVQEGYEVLEYVVEKQDQSLIPVLRFPSIVILCLVVLWSFSLISLKLGIFSILSVTVWAYVSVWNTVIQETLIVIRTLGIQVIQTNILGKMKHAKFVPINNIKGVVINEVIRRQRVIAYLLVLLESTESTGKIVVPLLIGTLPRLRTIEKIYSHIQRCIFKTP